MFVNKTILSDNLGNAIRVSKVQQMDGDIQFKGFSAKYVVSGQETYFVNKKRFSLSSNEFIVGNSTTEAQILINSKIPAHGLCIDIAPQTLKEVIDFQFDEKMNLENFLLKQSFFVNKYNDKNSYLGKKLNDIAIHFDTFLNNSNNLHSDLFYNLAECIITDQTIIEHHFSKLKTAKIETSKNLFHLIWDAKNFIDLHFIENYSIKNIATQIGLSEYHFLRLFKKVFTKTPHQYIVSKRLEFSKVLLLDNYSVQETAVLVGFADVFSFSKSFKATFGFSPNHFKKAIFDK